MRAPWRRPAATLAILVAAGASRLVAQDTLLVIRPIAGSDTAPAPRAVPTEIVQQLVALYNDSTTIRIPGSLLLPSGSALRGRVAVFRGTLRVFGRIEGSVAVLNGDLIVATGGAVVGPVVVVGGRIEVRPGGTLDGAQTVFEALAPIRRLPNGLVTARERKALGDLASARTTFQTGRIKTTLSLETGRTYNRVEGLPIVFGPSFVTEGPGSVDARLDVRGIFRPTSDRTKLRDNVGFVISTEWRGGGDRRWFGFGARGYRQILPIEDQPLGKGESGWSAFLLQRDYRDHYEARGIEGFVSAEPVPRLRLEASYRSDLERSVPASDPVSLFRNEDTWRPNPLIDDGHYRTLKFSLGYDTRNDRVRPSAGWSITADYEHSRSYDPRPVGLPSAVRPPIPASRYEFGKIRFDVRRYARINPSSRVSLRVVGGGWVDGDPLPVQRRVSLGGPDILPGFGFRALNCGPAGFVDPARASLCDRYLATQLEVRTNFPVRIPFRIRNADLAAVQQILGIEEADLVVLANAGKAWLSGDGPGRVPNDRIPNLGEWDADVGIGIDTGGLGLYVAKPIAADRAFRFVVRLERRF